MQLIEINRADCAVLEPYQNIKEKDLVGRQHKFIAEGRVVLSVLLHSSRFKAESILITQNRLPNMMPLLEQAKPDCPIYCVPQHVMDSVAGFPMHRGILAVGQKRETSTIEDFLQILAPQTSANLVANANKQLLVVLNNISNHDNVGSVFRNAAAFAADGVILDKYCCDPLYRKSIRVSVGAALKVPYLQEGTIDEIATHLQNDGWQLIALTGHGAVDITEVQQGNKVALLLGSEGDGLPKTVLEKIEGVRIPIARDFDSLNIATACGIALSQFADAKKLQ